MYTCFYYNVFIPAHVQPPPYTLKVDFFGTSAPVKNGEDGILIIRYPDGRASGDAFAIFEEEGHQEEALKLDRTNLGTRYVELYKSSLKEFRVVGVMEWDTKSNENMYMHMFVCV